jgi:hypothetical protein
VSRGASRESFWEDLVKHLPVVAYVGLRLLELTEIRTRQQIRFALQGLAEHRWFLIVDFEDVRFISEAASHELCVAVQDFWSIRVQPINMEPDVARTIRNVLYVNQHLQEQRI